MNLIESFHGLVEIEVTLDFFCRDFILEDDSNLYSPTKMEPICYQVFDDEKRMVYCNFTIKIQRTVKLAFYSSFYRTFAK